MKTTNQRLTAAACALAAATLVAGCASNGSRSGYYPAQYAQPTYQQPAYQQAAYSQLGQVVNVEYLRAGTSGDGITGAVIGGAVGGLAGSQLGGGRGRTAATVAGTVGGALIGRVLEQNMGNGGRDIYRVTVRFDDGSSRSFDYADAPAVRVGDRVRAEGNQLYR